MAKKFHWGFRIHEEDFDQALKFKTSNLLKFLLLLPPLAGQNIQIALIAKY